MTVLAPYGPAYPDAQEQSRAQTDLRRKLAHRRMDDARRLLVDTSDALASSEDLRSSLRAVARFDPWWDVVGTGRPRLEAEATPPLRRALTHGARHAVLLQRRGLESLL